GADPERWIALADVAVRRAGAPVELMAKLTSMRGFHAVATGKYAGALELQRSASALLAAEYGATDPRVVTSNYRLAVSLGMLGRCAEAEPLLREVLAQRTTSLGADHPGAVDA